FRKIIIEPQLDLRKVLPKNQSQITNVNAQVETVNGMVKSAWSIEGKEVTYHIFIPANTTATFVVPANQQGDIKKQNGILSVTLKNNKRMIELGSGDYEFKMKISN
ncbi:MAG: alpha-L-rhamnosidase C-terminal domain-containing protein, partial [Flavobacteriaceae bacterium]